MHVRNWTYQARQPRDPAHLELARQQQFLQWRYRNDLVRIELERRRACNEIVGRFGGLAELIAAAEQASASCDLVAQQIKNHKGATRSNRAPVELAAQHSHLKAQAKVCWQRAKEVRTAAYSDPTVREQLAQATEVSREAQRVAYRSFGQEGLPWGTRGEVAQAAQSFGRGSPPAFHRFQAGEGKISVQIQSGKGKRPLTVASLFAGTDTRVRVLKQPTVRGSKREQQYYDLHMQIGDTRRERQWIVIPFRLHRPIPENATIKWVRVLMRSVGVQTKWSVQFVIACPELEPTHPRGESGTVAVHLGWRLLPDGRLRVATWKDDHGQTGEWCMPADRMARWSRSESLRSIRDRMFDAIRATLTTMLEPLTPPDVVAERLAYMNRWRSQNRLATLIRIWGESRFDGDTAAFAAATEWLKQDRHLHDYEAFNRRKAANWRKVEYRKLAVLLSSRYKTLVIGQVNWKALGTDPDPAKSKLPEEVRHRRTIAPCGGLDATLRTYFGPADSLRLRAKHLTAQCSRCDHIHRGRQAATQELVCENCGASMDQDMNALDNLLKRMHEASATAVCAATASSSFDGEADIPDDE